MANEFTEHYEDGAADESMPQLPDGIGISYEDVAVLLAMKCDTSLSKDDPVLVLVSICNVFLGEIEKLHQRHNEAITKIIASNTKDYIASVKSNTDAFVKTLSEASVEGIREIFEKHATALQAAKTNMRWCTAICAVSSLVLVAGLALW